MNSNKPLGYLALVLHSHLPFVKHPEYPDFLEEDWLFEAMTESYIPLLMMLEQLRRENINFKLNFTLTPTLCEMLADDFLMDRYNARLVKLIELAEKEVIRCQKESPQFLETARLYLQLFNDVHYFFKTMCNGKILPVFKSLQDEGKIEILTSSATHAILPLIIKEEAIRAQIRVAVKNYEKHFGRSPSGIWLPECAYFQGLEKILAENNLKYFITDTHGFIYADRYPWYLTFAPIMTPSNVAVFARDMESSKQVWSAKEGYPGDFWYREFYKDIGYDLDYEYIKPYLHSDGVRRNIGIKYYRITGSDVPLHLKEPYQPAQATERAAVHAGNFMFNRQLQIRYIYELYKIKPIVVAPYDTELFGHWWFEGVKFLNFLIRKIAFDQKDIELIRLSDYLSTQSGFQGNLPSTSSWGDKGYFEVWLNGTNDWIYRHLHIAEDMMAELVKRFASFDNGIQKRVLNQALREFLLAQASDWAFLMTVGPSSPYAHKRFKEHITNFHKLYQFAISGQIDIGFLEWLEKKNSIFQEIDYKLFT